MTETFLFGTSAQSGASEAGNSVPTGEISLSTLRPLMEGARARGVADACELLGVGAILLDRCGRVLHVTSAAAPFIGETLRLVEDHLAAVDSTLNPVIEQVVCAALAGASSEDVFPCADETSLRLRATPMPGACDDDAQLLKAVLFLFPDSTVSAASSGLGATAAAA